MRKSALASVAELSEFIASGDLRYTIQPIHPLQQDPGDPWFEWRPRPALEDHDVTELDFLTAVESLELSLELDRRILADALSWRAERERLRLSVHISSAAFANRAFTETIARSLDSGGLKPAQLCFDLDIDDVARNLGRATRFVRSMGELGCPLSLDCDIAGDPMLALLAPLGLIGYLRVERKWVASAPVSEAHRVTLEGICEYGRRLGLELIGRGVDDEAQLQLLTGLGFDYYQGRLGGEPRPAAAEDATEAADVSYRHSA